jgi:hypothetical protein
MAGVWIGVKSFNAFRFHASPHKQFHLLLFHFDQQPQEFMHVLRSHPGKVHSASLARVAVRGCQVVLTAG